jgi:hypothetical protein
MSASGPARLRCGEFSHGSVKRTHKGPLRDALARNIPRLRAERGLSQEALAPQSARSPDPASATSTIVQDRVH